MENRCERPYLPVNPSLSNLILSLSNLILSLSNLILSLSKDKGRG